MLAIIDKAREALAYAVALCRVIQENQESIAPDIRDELIEGAAATEALAAEVMREIDARDDN